MSQMMPLPSWSRRCLSFGLPFPVLSPPSYRGHQAVLMLSAGGSAACRTSRWKSMGNISPGPVGRISLCQLGGGARRAGALHLYGRHDRGTAANGPYQAYQRR